MSTAWSNEGNIGQDVEFKVVQVRGEDRTLLQASVFFDNPVPKGDGFEDQGGFWAQVDWWHKDAEAFAEVFKKGMRVVVQGTLRHEEWTDDEGDSRMSVRIRADRMSMLPYRIESVELRPARARQTA